MPTTYEQSIQHTHKQIGLILLRGLQSQMIVVVFGCKSNCCMLPTGEFITTIEQNKRMRMRVCSVCVFVCGDGDVSTQQTHFAWVPHRQTPASSVNHILFTKQYDDYYTLAEYRIHSENAYSFACTDLPDTAAPAAVCVCFWFVRKAQLDIILHRMGDFDKSYVIVLTGLGYVLWVINL